MYRAVGNEKFGAFLIRYITTGMLTFSSDLVGIDHRNVVFFEVSEDGAFSRRQTTGQTYDEHYLLKFAVRAKRRTANDRPAQQSSTYCHIDMC